MSGPVTGQTTDVPPPPSLTPVPGPSPGDPAVTSAGTSPVPAVPVALSPRVADEASGLTIGTGGKGAYFLIDDGSGTTQVVAVDAAGQLLNRVAIAGMAAANSEALAAGPCGASPMPDGGSSETCLYVGDIGDNKEQRAHVSIFRFAEPDLAAPQQGPVPADQWVYRYPDGPHNAEAVLVDVDGSLLVVTKPAAGLGDLPHRMYRAAPGGGELTFVREFSPPPPERAGKTLFTGNVVTDLAATPGRVLLLTYDDVQEYTAPEPSAALSTFPDWPHQSRPLPAMPQAEGIAGASDGCGYAVASEGGPGGTHGWLAVVTCG